MNVLPDTSIWVEFLRRGENGWATGLGDLIRGSRVVVCGPVIAELLAAPSSRNLELEITLAGLPYAELDKASWMEVGRVARSLTTMGASVPLTDIEIAVASVRIDALLWTRDSDFARIKAAWPALRLYEPA